MADGRAGRPSKYTPERVARLTQAIELGATYELACAYAGITTETLDRWRSVHPELKEQISEAEGRATVKWLAKIEQAASEGTWQAAAWKLERRYPRMYGKQAIELSGDADAPISIALVKRDGPPPAVPAALTTGGDDEEEA